MGDKENQNFPDTRSVERGSVHGKERNFEGQVGQGAVGLREALKKNGLWFPGPAKIMG